MPSGSLGLQPGSVLHIEGFSSRGHPPKNKFLLVIGSRSDVEALGFLISSQLFYLDRISHKKEVVRIPDRATSFLRFESIIQCFELERLSILELAEGHAQGRVTKVGALSLKYLHKIRETVQGSRLLTELDIESALAVLPRSTQKQP